jgi:hypothetical protein
VYPEDKLIPVYPEDKLMLEYKLILILCVSQVQHLAHSIRSVQGMCLRLTVYTRDSRGSIVEMLNTSMMGISDFEKRLGGGCEGGGGDNAGAQCTGSSVASSTTCPEAGCEVVESGNEVVLDFDDDVSFFFFFCSFFL